MEPVQSTRQYLATRIRQLLEAREIHEWYKTALDAARAEFEAAHHDLQARVTEAAEVARVLEADIRQYAAAGHRPPTGGPVAMIDRQRCTCGPEGACQACWKGEDDDWEFIHDEDCERCRYCTGCDNPFSQLMSEQKASE